MHFRAEMTVMLNEPMQINGLKERAIGYIIVIGINAANLAVAVQFAHNVALQPKQEDGSFRSFDGVVVEAQVQRIEKTDWEPIIQQKAKRIDKEGVYYSTGLVFFGPGNENNGG